MDPEKGARVPMQSLKLHAEVAGIGARSMAGDILLHPEFGMMYYASVFTELEMPPDQPMAENPCPHPSCVTLYRRTGQTPCQKFCPVECLSGSIDEVSWAGNYVSPFPGGVWSNKCSTITTTVLRSIRSLRMSTRTRRYTPPRRHQC